MKEKESFPCRYCDTPREAADDWTCCEKAHLEHLRTVSQEFIVAVSEYVRSRRAPSIQDPGLRRTISNRMAAARKAVEEAISA